MLAGNETSSTALTWTLYALTHHPDCQRRLREELSAVNDDRPSMDDLATLPYLDAVVRESLRLLPPVTATVREAVEDVVLPISKPTKDRNGNMIDTVKLTKGTTLLLRESASIVYRSRDS